MRSPPSLRLGLALFGAVGVQSIADTSNQTQGQRTQPPVVVAFDLNGGATSLQRADSYLTLSHRVVGTTPIEYRTSARPDFSGAAWRTYATPLRLRDWTTYARADAHCQGNANGSAIVMYFQVRAQTGSALQIIDGRRVLVPQLTESNVVADSICVVRETETAPTHSA